MKRSSIFLLPLLALCATACMKEQRQVAQDLGLVPEGCGSEGMRLEASINGGAFCPDMQLVAVGDDASVMITGVDIAGNTLVLQVEALDVGEHAITEAVNSVLFMQLGMTYTVPPGAEGVLQIAAHDAPSRRLQGSFQVILLNELNGTTRSLSGSLDVTYAGGPQ